MEGEVGAAEGLGEEAGFGVGGGGFEFPAEVEFAGDAVAGGGVGLGEQGFLCGIEALPGEGAKVGREVTFQQEVVDELGFGFLGEQGFDVFFEEGAVLAGEEEVEFVAGMLGEEFEFSGFIEVRPFGEENELAQAVVGAHAVEELVGIGEGGEGAPVGIEQVFDGGGGTFGEHGGAAGGKVVGFRVERAGDTAVAQGRIDGGKSELEGIVGEGVGGDDFEKLAAGEVIERQGERAVGRGGEVEFYDGGHFKEVADGGVFGAAGSVFAVGTFAFAEA